MVSASQVMIVPVRVGAFQLCFWPGLSRQELTVQHIYGTMHLPIAHERWSWYVSAKLPWERSWLDRGLQPGCCACGEPASSNPTTQHTEVWRTFADNSSDCCIYLCWLKNCLMAGLGFGKFAGMVCYHESGALVYCGRTWDLFQQDAEETV